MPPCLPARRCARTRPRGTLLWLNRSPLASCNFKHGLYPIQNVNQLHSSLKAFLRPFHGVSTKYLPNYMTWLQAMVIRDASGRKLERASDCLRQPPALEPSGRSLLGPRLRFSRHASSQTLTECCSAWLRRSWRPGRT